MFAFLDTKNNMVLQSRACPLKDAEAYSINLIVVQNHLRTKSKCLSERISKLSHYVLFMFFAASHLAWNRGCRLSGISFIFDDTARIKS